MGGKLPSDAASQPNFNMAHIVDMLALARITVHGLVKDYALSAVRRRYYCLGPGLVAIPWTHDQPQCFWFLIRDA